MPWFVDGSSVAPTRPIAEEHGPADDSVELPRWKARPASARTGRFIRRHLPLLAAVPVLVVFFWMVTYGAGRLFEAEDFGQLYDAQARSLRSGRWDVAPEAIGEEAFIRDGKHYGYFGFVPAVPRMALNALFPAL